MSTKHKIQQISKITDTVFTISLDRNGLEFEPGANVVIKGKPYSISSSPTDDNIRLLVRKMDNGRVSNYLFNQNLNNEIEIEDVFNYFHPGKNCSRGQYVYIATGVGISPFLSALKFYEHVPFMLCYGVRTRKEIFDPQAFEYVPYQNIAISRDENEHGPKRITDPWILQGIPIDKDFKYYLCGVDDMINEVSSHLIKRGIEVSQIASELFFM